MSRILTIGFEFHDQFYYSLIRVNEMLEETEYKITIMNGPLEKILLGNNIIVGRKGFLNIELSENVRQQELKLIIAEALSNLLSIPLETNHNFKISIKEKKN